MNACEVEVGLRLAEELASRETWSLLMITVESLGSSFASAGLKG
jgi:hypothetical protein